MKLGCALISFNRPHYFSQVVDSLEQQTQLDDTDFHLFLDGSINKFSKVRHSKDNLIRESEATFDNSNLPNKTKHVRKENVGNGIQQFEAVEFMSRNYDYFMIIEDDIVLSKHYLRLIRLLIPEIKGDVFSANLNSRRLCDKKDIQKHLRDYTYSNTHWFAECWSAKQWEKVKPDYLKYYRHIKSCDYSRRPHGNIRRLFKRNKLNIPQTSQDAGKDFALFRNKMRRITTMVNRGFYIGSQGMHFRPQVYDGFGFGKMKPYEFESDARMRGFKYGL